MAVKYNLSAEEALKLFLGGAECGLPESVLSKTEKEIGAKIHPVVRKFAAKYFYMPVNSGRTRLGDFHIAHVGNETRVDDYLVIGCNNDTLYAVLSPDSRENPPISVGRIDGDTVSWSLSPFMLHDYFCMVIAEGFSPYCEAAFGDNSEEIARIAEIFGADLNKLEFDSDCGFSLCCNDERQELAAFFYNEGELKNAAVYAATQNEIERTPFGGNTNEELKRFFEDEFYINSINCNYEYALLINSERLKRTKESGAFKTQAAELERLSARCLWALGRYDEAEKLLNSAAGAFSGSLIGTYTALANMFDEAGDSEKSDKALDAVMTLSELSGDYDSLGMMYQSRAMKLDKDMETIDRAIELYEKAIEMFQKMPRPNKHDIARTQQLRGEARRRKKDFLKSSEQ